MKKNNLTKSDLVCNIFLCIILLFTLTHLTITTLGFFEVINLNLPEDFSYIVSYILTIVSLGLFVFGFFLSKFANLYIPAWFKITFYIAFFMFTNVYYIYGWYEQLIGLLFFYAYIAFLACISCLSVYFNTQKDEKNKLKASSKSLLTSVFFYSLALCSILEFVVNFIKVIAFPRYTFSTLSVYLMEFGTMLAVNVILIIAYAISLYSTKRFINACLIKVNRVQKNSK